MANGSSAIGSGPGSRSDQNESSPSDGLELCITSDDPRSAVGLLAYWPTRRCSSTPNSACTRQCDLEGPTLRGRSWDRLCLVRRASVSSRAHSTDQVPVYVRSVCRTSRSVAKTSRILARTSFSPESPRRSTAAAPGPRGSRTSACRSLVAGNPPRSPARGVS